MNDKKYQTVDELLEAVRKFINDHDTSDLSVVDVYLGRGVHRFEYDNKLADAIKQVEELESKLEEAKKNLEQDVNSKKRKHLPRNLWL